MLLYVLDINQLNFNSIYKLFTFTKIFPLGSVMYWVLIVSKSSFVSTLIWIFIGSLVDSIRAAVLTVSPNKQYRGILLPITPATTLPDKNVQTRLLQLFKKRLIVKKTRFTSHTIEITNLSEIRHKFSRKSLRLWKIELSLWLIWKSMQVEQFLQHVSFLKIKM